MTTTEIEASVLRQAFGRFPTGVTALCGFVDEAPVGMAINSFTSVSLDPPLVSACIQKSSASWPLLRRSRRIGVSVLNSEHEHVSRQLSRKGIDRFKQVVWYRTVHDAVFISDSALELECTVEEEIDAGDHLIAILRVQDLAIESNVRPIVFHDSKYRTVAEK